MPWDANVAIFDVKLLFARSLPAGRLTYAEALKREQA
jgi:hypothetical protein